MPDYFRKFTNDGQSVGGERVDPLYSKFKDSRDYEREREEGRLAEELREREHRARYPLPNFEKMIQDLKSEKQEEDKRTRKALSIMAAVSVFTICTIMFWVNRFS